MAHGAFRAPVGLLAHRRSRVERTRSPAQAWDESGGSHNSAFTSALGMDALVDLADIAGLEFVVIDAQTELRRPRGGLR